MGNPDVTRSTWPRERAFFAGALALLTAGICFGISFIEAPVKFLTPSLTYAVALDVGRHVFKASELVQLALLMSCALLALGASTREALRWLVVALGVLLLQRLWLFPQLEARALVHLAGRTPPAGAAHHVYVALELCKLSALYLFGRRQLWYALRAPAPPARTLEQDDRHEHAAAEVAGVAVRAVR